MPSMTLPLDSTFIVLPVFLGGQPASSACNQYFIPQSKPVHPLIFRKAEAFDPLIIARKRRICQMRDHLRVRLKVEERRNFNWPSVRM